MTDNEEIGRIYVEVKKWVEDNKAQFECKCEPLYDKDNLEKRIKRFANAPIEYIDERIELNKEVSKNYHKIHLSVLLAGFTGLYVGLLYQSIIYLVKISWVNPEFTIITWQHIVLLVILLIIGPLVAIKTHITYQILKATGLLKVIRDSEIEIYYLSKIKEFRKQSQP